MRKDGHRRLWVLLLAVLAVLVTGAVYRVNQPVALNAALCRAVVAGDATGTKALLQRGADANTRCDYAMELMPTTMGRLHLLWGRIRGRQIPPGSPLLNIAAAQDDTAVAKLLLSHGADVNAKASYGNTALHTAVRGPGGNVLLLRLLLAAGADVNARTHGGRTAVWSAKYEKKPEATALLRRAGARE